MKHEGGNGGVPRDNEGVSARSKRVKRVRMVEGVVGE